MKPGDVADAVNSALVECRPIGTTEADVANVLAAFIEMIGTDALFPTDRGDVRITSVRLSDDGRSILLTGYPVAPGPITITVKIEGDTCDTP